MKKRAPVASIVLVAALVVVGCSDDDQSGAETTTGQPPASTSTADRDDPSASVPSTSEVSTSDGTDKPTTTAAESDSAATIPDSTNPDDLEATPTSAVIDTGEGEVQIGSGSVPPIARDLPIPDGLEIELSSTTDTSAGFSGTIAGTVSDIAAFYRTELPASGFTIDRDTQAGPAVLLTFSGDAGSGEIAISEAPGNGGASVIVTFDVP